MMNRVNDRAILLCVRKNLERCNSLPEAKAKIDLLLFLNSALINPEIEKTPEKLKEFISLKEKAGAVTF